ncbi:MAG: hypothetical protein KKD39_03840 [Candidatus Altiarchaeota archaeon]|nr:hypothetical protein [Candidatus Altiarchaeota archaeon]
MVNEGRLYSCVFFLFLMLPLLAWIFMDESVWIWDCADYGFFSVKSYDELVSNPRIWIQDIFTSQPYRAPLIFWIGQFFVPLGDMIGSVDAGLLIFMFLTSYLSVNMMYSILEHLCKNKYISALGCLMLISAPSFVGFTTHYYTQPLQLLAVVWSMHILSKIKKIDVVNLFFHTISLVAVSLLIKTTMLLYIIIPITANIIYILKKWKKPLAIDTKTKMAGLTTLTLTTLTITWYAKNYGSIVEYIIYSISDYGFEDTFLNKMIYWLEVLYNSMLLPQTIVFLGILLLIYFRKTYKNIMTNTFGILSLAQILLALTICSTAYIAEPNLMYPLIPYCIILFCLALKEIIDDRAYMAAIAVVVLQILTVYSMAFGLIENKIDSRIYVFSTIAGVNTEHKIIENVSKSICKEGNSYGIIAADTYWFNQFALNYYTYKNHRNPEMNCKAYYMKFLLDNWYMTRDDDAVEEIWTKIEVYKPLYYITLNRTIYPTPFMPFTGYSSIISEISERVKNSEMYEQVKVDEENKVLFYKLRHKR